MAAAMDAASVDVIFADPPYNLSGERVPDLPLRTP
jgi:DNA modification methylase